MKTDRLLNALESVAALNVNLDRARPNGKLLPTPRTSLQAEQGTSIARLLDADVVALRTAAAPLFNWADSIRAAMHAAESDARRLRQRHAVHHLSKFERAILDTVKSFGEDVARAMYDAGVSKGETASEFDNLCELAIDDGGYAELTEPEPVQGSVQVRKAEKASKAS